MANNFSDVRAEITATIKPNGVGAITGQVLQDAMLNLVGATEGEMSALTESTDEKLAQLDQEWTDVKEKIEGSVLEVAVTIQPHIEKVVVTDGAAILEPDKFYDFGETANLAIGLQVSETGYAAQYAFQFKSPADTPTILTMPENIIFPVESNSLLIIQPARIYQITIVDNLAVATSWEG